MSGARSAPRFFGRDCLDALTASASAIARRRKNLNFHKTADHPAQRLLNAVEPDSYICPHRHPDPLRDETFVVLRGAFGLICFDDAGAVTHTALLRAGGELSGAHIPGGTYHALVSLEPGSIFFEAKAGPYEPLTDKDFGRWAPREGHPDVPAYHRSLRDLFR